MSTLSLIHISMYDELSLDTVGDKKTALFLIMSDTDPTFNLSLIHISKDQNVMPPKYTVFFKAKDA